MNRPMSAENLIELVSGVRGPKVLVVEESELAQWVKETLTPYVDRLVVSDPKRNRWIAKADFNNDRTSAIKLAELQRGGYIKKVHHLEGAEAQLRRRFLHYADLNDQVRRFKNKLKAIYRQEGITATGDGVYPQEQRGSWLDRLKGSLCLRHQAERLHFLLDTVGAMKQESLSGMKREAKKGKGYELLLTIPGVGPVVACGYMALIGTPHRFSRKNKLWRYAGFGNMLHISADRVYADRPSKTGNRLLKWVVGQQFMGAVQRTRKDNVFKRRYARLRREGHSAKVARRHVCRSLLSVVRAVWMKGEAYREAEIS